jgi:DNA-binding phage protein
MALTRGFRETSYVRAVRDEAFRKALLTAAVDAYFDGDEPLGKTILRAMVDATIGFEQLAVDVGKTSESLHRMLAPRGNPNTATFFAILRSLQKRLGVTLTVRAA